MRPADIQIAIDLTTKINEFQNTIPLPGLETPAHTECFVKQIIDSIRRIKYVKVINERNINAACADPNDIDFNPLKAAVFYKRGGNIDEAFWLVFLSTHFGRNLRTNWRLVRDVYGNLGNAPIWNWNTITGNVPAFRDWLDDNHVALKAVGKFGNHRKFESLRGNNANGTGETIASYISWVQSNGGHAALIATAIQNSNNDPRLAFRNLYYSMNDVFRFGRTAKFDYLTMVGKFGLADIIPGETFLGESTGPITGAKQLFGENLDVDLLNDCIAELDSQLDLDYGMQVIEDALCNWQKNKNQYVYFRG